MCNFNRTTHSKPKPYFKHHSKSGHKKHILSFSEPRNGGCLVDSLSQPVYTTLSLLPGTRTARRQMGQVEFSESQRSIQ